MLVYSEPGPNVITSALAIASRASLTGCERPGLRKILSIDWRLLLILLSPEMMLPSASRASSVTLAAVAGKILPRIARISEESRTALAKSPVIWLSAARNKFPKLCPFKPRARCEPVLKQPREQRLIFRQSHHAVADITGRQNIQSRRRRPELPPSSLTVTTR